MKQTYPFLSALGLIAAVAGCDPRAAEYCDAKCDCRPCNELEYDECIIENEKLLDQADAYGCTDQADDLLDCAVERGYCDNLTWRYDDTCIGYWAAVDACIDINSARYNSIWH